LGTYAVAERPIDSTYLVVDVGGGMANKEKQLLALKNASVGRGERRHKLSLLMRAESIARGHYEAG
jgi:hypothetical protein